MSNETQSILRIVNDKGEVTETLTVNFNPLALSYGLKKKLIAQSDPMKFIKYDMSKFNHVSKEGAEIKEMDLVAMQSAEKEADEELTKCVWGIKDVNLDTLVPDDFEKLLDITVKADLLKREAKKKVETITAK